MNYDLLNAINNAIWSYVVITMLVGCAIYFTWNLRAVQFTMLPTMIRNLFKPSDETFEKIGKKKVSSFQAFAISLSSRVGTGNLAGVASAIFVGGPGAVFWMWVMALLGDVGNGAFRCQHRFHGSNTGPTIQAQGQG